MTRDAAFLPPAMLERLGGLEVVARTVVRGLLAGLHRSPLRGAGEEFARHREYQPGDDLRRLDWRVFARSDRLYVREHEERSSLRAWLVVDASASMAFAERGGVPKLRYAAYVTAALAFLMLRAGDSVGLATFGDEPRLLMTPRTRRGQLHDLLLQLERLSAVGNAGAAAALDRVGQVLPRRGRVVLVSDLLEEDGGEALTAAAARLAGRGDEVAVLRVLTPAELGEGAPEPGLFFDPERPSAVIAAAPGDDAGYTARVGRYYDGLSARLRERGVEYVPIRTDRPVEEALGAWLRARRG